MTKPITPTDVYQAGDESVLETLPELEPTPGEGAPNLVTWKHAYEQRERQLLDALRQLSSAREENFRHGKWVMRQAVDLYEAGMRKEGNKWRNERAEQAESAVKTLTEAHRIAAEIAFLCSARVTELESALKQLQGTESAADD